MNKECEHEWGAEWTTTSVRDVRITCSKCGVSKHQSEIILQPTENREDDIKVHFINTPIFDDQNFHKKNKK